MNAFGNFLLIIIIIIIIIINFIYKLYHTIITIPITKTHQPQNLFPAGSCGDPNASQLIVDNRAVTIEYARELQNRNRNERDEDFHHPSDKEDRRRLPGNGYGPPPVKCDWICDSVCLVILCEKSSYINIIIIKFIFIINLYTF